MKRFFLFALTNILVVVTISIVLNLIGATRYITAAGLDYYSLGIFCLVWGCVGSLISLMLSKVMAKWTLGIKTIDKSNPQFSWLVSMVERLALKAGLPVTPEVGVYNSPEVNAFATGPSKRNSLVAFSAGLLSGMTKEEIEGVAAHEIAHIQNGDMVTMTLLQGVMNAFVMFLARVIAFALSQRGSEDRESRGTNMWVVMLLEIVLGILGSLVVRAFSRWREFRADKGGADFAGRHAMIAALERLKLQHQGFDQHQNLAAFKISGVTGWFATHPPLEKRIEALKKGM